jgi:hypothetical protein
VADNKVIFEVVTTAKGTKRVQKQTDDLAKSTDRADRSTKKLTKSRDRYNRKEKGVAGISSNSTKNFSKMQQSIDGGGGGGLVRSYALLAANVFAVTAAFGVLSRSAEIDILTNSMDRLSAVGGTSIKGITKDLVEASGGAIDFASGMRQVALASSAGISGDKIKELTTVARGASQALGRDMGDSLDRIFRGAIKLEPELLDEIGLFVRVDEASEKYAQTIGKTAGELTQFEKRQGFLNAVTEQGTRKFKDFADSVDPNVYSRLAASFADIAQSVLSFLNRALGPMIGFLVDNKVLIVGLFSAIAFTIGKQIVPSLGSFTSGLASTARASAQEANEYILDQNQKLDAYQKFQKGVKAGEAKAAKTAANVSRDFKGTMFKSSATNPLNADDNVAALNDKKLKGTERQKVVEERITILTKARARANKENKKIIDAELVVRKAETAQLTLQKKLEREISLESKNQLTTTTSSIAARNQVKLDNVAARSAGVANVAGAGEIGGLGAGFGVLKDTLKSGKVEVDGVSKSLTGLNRVMFGVQGGTALLGQGIQKLFMIMGPWMMLLGLLAPFLPLIAKGLGISTKESKALSAATKDLAKETEKLEEKFKIQMDMRNATNASLKQQRDSYIATNKTIVESLTSVIKLEDKIADMMDSLTFYQRLTNSFGPMNDAMEAAAENIGIVVSQMAGTSKEVDAILLASIPFTKEDHVMKNLVRSAEGFQDRIKEGNIYLATQNDLLFKNEKLLKDSSISEERANVAKKKSINLAKLIKTEEFNQKNLRKEMLSIGERISGFLIADTNNARKLLKIQQEQLRIQQALASAIDGAKDAAIDFSTKFIAKTDVDAVAATFRQMAAASDEQFMSIQDQDLLMREMQDKNGHVFSLLNEQNRVLALNAITHKQIVDILKNQRNEYAGQQANLVLQASTVKRLVVLQKQLSKTSKESSVLLAKDFGVQDKIRNINIEGATEAKDRAKDQADMTTGMLNHLTAITDVSQREMTIKNLKLDVLKAENAINANLKLQALKREDAFKDATAEFEQTKLINGTLLKRLDILQKLGESRLKTEKMERRLSKVLSGRKSTLTPQETAKFDIKAAETKFKFEQSTAALRMAVLDAENAIIDARVALLVKQKVITQDEADVITNTLDKANNASKNLIQQGVKQAGLAMQQTMIDAISTSGQSMLSTVEMTAAALANGVGGSIAFSLKQAEQFEAQAKVRKEKEDYVAKTPGASITEGGATSDELLALAAKAKEDAANAINLITQAAKRAALDNFADTMKELGPEGAFVSSVVAGTLVITDAFTKMNESMMLVTKTMFDADGNLLEGFTETGAAMAKGAAMAEMASVAIGAIGQMLSQNSTRQTAAIDQQIQAEKNRDGQSEASLSKIASLEKKKDAIAKKSFDTQKKVQMAVTIANTAAGIMGAMAPPPIGLGVLGIPLAKMYAVMGALQLAVISRTQYGGASGGSAPEAPAMTGLSIGGRNSNVDVSKGGNAGELAYLRGSRGVGSNANNFTPGGAMGRKGYANGGNDIVVGERGPEVISPSTPIDITPNYELGGGETNVTLNISAIDGQSVANMFSDQQGNIIQLIRDAANDNGEAFLETVDPTVYGGTGG